MENDDLKNPPPANTGAFSDPKVAESATFDDATKNAKAPTGDQGGGPKDRNAELTPIDREKELDDLMALILSRTKRTDHGALDPVMMKALKDIEDQQLYCARRLEDGSREFDSFDDFIENLADHAREHLKKENNSGCIQTGYKLINESVVVNKLVRQIKSPPPVRRAQAQVLEKCKEENRAEIWDTAYVRACGQDIKAPLLRTIAREKGEQIDEPAPSNSQKFTQLQGLYPVLKGAFEQGAQSAGLSTQFTEFDKLIAKSSREKAEDLMKLPPTAPAAKPGPPGPAPAKLETPSAPAPAKLETPSAPVGADAGEQSARPPIQRRLAPAEVWAENDEVVIKLDGQDHWSAVRPKVDLRLIGYVFRSGMWRRKCTSIEAARKARDSICAAFAKAGVAYTEKR